MSISGILKTVAGQTTDGTSDSGEFVALVATVIGVYAIIILVAVVLALISWIVLSIGLSAVFRRTGVEPWKAWVPVYSNYTWLRLGGQNGHWAWAALIPYGGIVTSIFLYIGMHRTGIAFGKQTGFLVLGIFLPWVWVFMLGFGKDEYRPGLITAAGLGGPLIGYGAVAPPAGYAGYAGGAGHPGGYQSGYGAVQQPGYQPGSGAAPYPPAGYVSAPQPQSQAPAQAPAPSAAPTPSAPPAPPSLSKDQPKE